MDGSDPIRTVIASLAKSGRRQKSLGTALIALAAWSLPSRLPAKPSVDAISAHEGRRLAAPAGALSEELFDVIWDGHRFLTCGARGRLSSSSDGLVWNPIETGVTTSLRRLSPIGSSLFVLGDEGLLLRSDDGGAHWRKIPIPVTRSLLGLAAGGERYVIVGEAGTVLTSPDAESWQVASSSVSSDLESVAWGNGTFVATSRADGLLASRDGVEWTSVYPRDADQYRTTYGEIVWTGSRFLAGGHSVVITDITPPEGPTTATSRDGFSWALHAWAGGIEMAWSGSRWIGSSGSSLDGIDWTSDNHDVGFSPTRIAASEEITVLIGPAGSMARALHPRPNLDRLGPFVRVVPVSATSPGDAGSNWSSDLVISNPGDRRSVVDLFFLGEAAAAGLVVARQIEIPAFQAIALDDVVAASFGLSPASGAILVSAEGPLEIRSVTKSTLSVRTIHQEIPTVDPGEALSAGEFAGLAPVVDTDRFRTNVGFVNLSPLATQLDVELHSPDGRILGRTLVSLGAWRTIRRNRLSRSMSAEPVSGAWLSVRHSTEGARVLAWASVIDAEGGEARFHLARRPSSKPLLVPIVAHTPGGQGSFWTSDLVIVNPGETDGAVRIERIAGGSIVAVERRLAAGESQLIPDVLTTLFEESGAAALRILPTAGSWIATSWSNDQSTTSARGPVVPSLREEELLTDASEGWILPPSGGRSADSWWGFELVVFNPGSSSVDLEFTDVFRPVHSPELALFFEMTRRSIPASSTRRFELSGAGSAVLNGAVLRVLTPGGRVAAWVSAPLSFTDFHRDSTYWPVHPLPTDIGRSGAPTAGGPIR